MKLSGNTVLITGGTSGIGYEFAAQLLKRGNTVIVTGRDWSRLEQAQRGLPGIHAFQSDVSNTRAIPLLFSAVIEKFPALNMLINNAGIMREVDLLDQGTGLEDIGREIATNLIGTVCMVKEFLPHLNSQAFAAIANISSGLAFVPLPIAPTYCAAKAGVHSFTLSLRVQLKGTPLTQTSLFREVHVEKVKGIRMMDVSKMVGKAIQGLERDHFEVRPGLSNVLKLMSRVAPEVILNRLSANR